MSKIYNKYCELKKKNKDILYLFKWTVPNRMDKEKKGNGNFNRNNINWYSEERSVSFTMDIHEKELALNQILKEIEMLENFIEETTSTYYLPKTIRVNGIQLEISTFDLIQTIKSDYKNIVLKDFYDEIEEIF